MNLYKRALFARLLMDKAGDGTGGPGGSGSGDDDGDEAKDDAAKAEADRIKAEAEKKKLEDSGTATTEQLKAKDDEIAAHKADAEKLLKETMRRKDTIKELNDKLAKFEGIDPVAVKKLLDEQKTAETKKLEEKGQWDALKEQMVKANQEEKDELLSIIEKGKKTTEAKDKQVNELTIGNAFGNSKFITDETILSVAKARVIYGGHFEFDTERSAIVAFDLASGSANRTMLIDGVGEPLTFEKAIVSIIEADPDKDTLIKAKARGGTGSSKLSDNSSSKGSEKTGAKTGLSKIEAGLNAKPLRKTAASQS